MAITLGSIDRIPDVRTATVSFDVVSDLGRIRFEILIAPEAGSPDGLDAALQIARKSLAEFGRALAEEADKEIPPITIYSLQKT
jgi:hypothetical protein